MVPQSTFVNRLRIRTAEPDDLEAVYEFICALEEKILDRGPFSALYLRNLSHPSVYYLVAEQAGETVGFLSCHVQELLHHGGKVGEIQELYVKPEYRNQQIGRELIAAINTIAVREGLINLEVTTNQKRIDTVRFYEREAFIRTHVKLVKPLRP